MILPGTVEFVQGLVQFQMEFVFSSFIVVFGFWLIKKMIFN